MQGKGGSVEAIYVKRAICMPCYTNRLPSQTTFTTSLHFCLGFLLFIWPSIQLRILGRFSFSIWTKKMFRCWPRGYLEHSFHNVGGGNPGKTSLEKNRGGGGRDKDSTRILTKLPGHKGEKTNNVREWKWNIKAICKNASVSLFPSTSQVFLHHLLQQSTVFITCQRVGSKDTNLLREWQWCHHLLLPHNVAEGSLGLSRERGG